MESNNKGKACCVCVAWRKKGGCQLWLYYSIVAIKLEAIKTTEIKPKKKTEEPSPDSGLYSDIHYLGTIPVVCEDSHVIVDMYVHFFAFFCIPKSQLA